MKHLLTLDNMGKEHYIREHMKAAGVGIVELSRRLGQTRQNVHMQIDKSSMTLQTLYRIAAALEVPAHLLLLPPDAAFTQSTPGRTAGKQKMKASRIQTEPPLHFARYVAHASQSRRVVAKRMLPCSTPRGRRRGNTHIHFLRQHIGTQTGTHGCTLSCDIPLYG